MTRAPGSYAGLTERQADLLSYLRRQNRYGHCPTFPQMQDALGLASNSTIQYLVNQLEKRGFIRRIEGKRQSIQCVSRADARLSTYPLPSLIREIEARGMKVVPA